MRSKMIWASALILFACQSEPDIEVLKAELRATDSLFSAMAENKGAYAAFTTYADSSVIELNEGAPPVMGLTELKKKYKALDNSKFSLSWKVLRCDVSKSGDLGYTFGDYQLHLATATGADTVLHGNYITVWKKRADGTWRFVLDGGNNTPGPTAIEAL